MQIGNDKMTKDGVESTLDSAPVIIDSRTLVPVRAIAESFGSDVSWEAETKTVIVKDLPKEEVTDETEGEEKTDEEAAASEEEKTEESTEETTEETTDEAASEETSETTEDKADAETESEK